MVAVQLLAVPMGPDVLGLAGGTQLLTVPLMVVAMLSVGQEGLEAARVVGVWTVAVPATEAEACDVAWRTVSDGE
ncbi:hypothetical protein ACFYW8_43210 [Streptomyces sp. NPDC002742]|uniref:hypothetical protein n=1 Tax=Streptomyces sp. NPDC002742 TaxID=3364663 RepID=UPI00369BE2CA